jgi:hypothetical protein
MHDQRRRRVSRFRFADSLDPARQPHIILMQKANPPAPREPQPFIAAPNPVARVRPPRDREIQPLLELIQNPTRRIRRTIIDRDNLDPVIRLPGDVLERGWQMRCPVERGHDDG